MRTILASAVAATALATTPAIANTDADLVEVRVSVADLDLDTAAGRAALEERVETEARRACKAESALGRGPEKTDWECVEAAKTAALAQVESERGADSAMAAE